MADHQFKGFSTSPSGYVKVAGSFFCLHAEQVFAPFYNLCYEGGTTWWVVHRDDWDELVKYVARRAREWYGVPKDVLLKPAEEKALHGLLYTKQVLFHPDDVAAAGIRLTKVTQVAGQIVMGGGDMMHFGVHAERRGGDQRERGDQLPPAAVADHRPAPHGAVAALTARRLGADAAKRHCPVRAEEGGTAGGRPRRAHE